MHISFSVERKTEDAGPTDGQENFAPFCLGCVVRPEKLVDRPGEPFTLERSLPYSGIAAIAAGVGGGVSPLLVASVGPWASFVVVSVVWSGQLVMYVPERAQS